MGLQKEYKHHDEVLGDLRVTLNARAKRFIVRMKEGRLHITMPPYCNAAQIEKMLLDNRDDLLELMRKNKKVSPENPLFTEGKMETLSFTIVLEKHEKSDKLAYQLRDSVLTIYYPATRELSDLDLQNHINKITNFYLRKEAQLILIPMAEKLANEHNLSFANIKISSSHSRWGSCSESGNINLSFNLMKKPIHLIKYVILHELAHLTELNHSPRFWALLDSYCGQSSRLLSNELNGKENLEE